MDIVWILVTFVPALMILVFVHELGHFLAARLFGMRVDRFSIGFPPNIAKKKIGQTEYVLGITPLGGYVKIAGMIDESMDTDFEDKPPEPDEYRSKPIWQRMIVISAGVVFNVLLAFVVFAMLLAVYGDSRPAYTEDGSIYVADSSLAADDIGLRTGDRLLSIGGTEFDPATAGDRLMPLLADHLTFRVERNGQELLLEGPDDIMTRIQEASDGGLYGMGMFNWPSIIGEVSPGSPADDAGLQEGDRITGINGKQVRFWPEMTELIKASHGDSLRISWTRPASGDQLLHAWLIPEAAAVDGIYRIGVLLPQLRESVPLPKALVAGIASTWDNTRVIATSLSRIASGRESVRENLGGPVMVAQVIGQAARSGPFAFWNIVAVLSITLAIVNILPIPVLDGGHLVFLVYEAIVRREPSFRFRMITQQVGLALLGLLMVFLILNDILRWVGSGG